MNEIAGRDADVRGVSREQARISRSLADHQRQAAQQAREAEREHRRDRSHTRPATDRACPAGVARLKGQKLFARDLVYMPFDFVDAAENVLLGTGMNNRQSQQPRQGHRHGEKHAELRGAGQRADCSKDGHQRTADQRQPLIHSRKPKRKQSVECTVLLDQHANKVAGIEAFRFKVQHWWSERLIESHADREMPG
ncbi:MAG: hypothetical protein U1D55_07455 [Phycisphaerae bacterium]